MNTFVKSLNTPVASVARTNNGALTHATSTDPVVDLFFLAGASRGKDITGLFGQALSTEPELALRLALWARDVRGGAGEREIFRSFLKYLEKNDFASLGRIMPRVPDLGRWDDLLVFETPQAKELAFILIQEGLEKGNGLCAKWMPRKGPLAEELRAFLGYSPKRYRKTLVSMTKVVETQMCAKNWKEIVYDHVPSVASKRYRKAFYKHDPEGFGAYIASLKKAVETGEKSDRKINAGAIFPHDIVSGLIQDSLGYYGRGNITQSDIDHAMVQWAALPDFVGEGSFITLSDVSGSMGSPVGNTKTRMIDVSIALGLYCSERNKGAFKDVVLHFSSTPYIEVLKGNLAQRISQFGQNVHMSSTNLDAAMKAILSHAKTYKVPQEEMPKTLLIISDMEFNATCSGNFGEVTNYDNARRLYAEAGYDMPNIVFWNLNGRQGNSPVKSKTPGVGLVSGFSPSIMKSILSAKSVTPRDLMLNTIMNTRYDLAG